MIVTATYLLSRGRTLDSIFARRPRSSAIAFGLVLGLLGATEVVFPSMRAPYVSNVLAISIAALGADWVGVVTAVGVVGAFAFFLQPLPIAVETIAVLSIVGAGARLFDHMTKRSRIPWIVGVLGAALQVAALLICDGAAPLIGFRHGWFLSPMTVAANGFGAFLIMLVLGDTNARALSERARLDSEKVKTLRMAADLAALRARIRPHFLFNTLTALASLCHTDPLQAEKSIVKLGRLMRGTLAVDTSALTEVGAEIEYVKAYVDIQTLRFGGGIEVKFELDPRIMSTLIPAFCLQTLVENAFQHGFENRAAVGEIRVIGRRSNQSVLLSVWDSGAGMSSDTRRRATEEDEMPRHGVGIVDKQLRLQFGTVSRLRVLSTTGKGTLVAFRVPSS